MSYYTEGHIQSIRIAKDKISFTIIPVPEFMRTSQKQPDKQLILFISEDDAIEALPMVQTLNSASSEDQEFLIYTTRTVDTCCNQATSKEQEFVVYAESKVSTNASSCRIFATVTALSEYMHSVPILTTSLLEAKKHRLKVRIFVKNLKSEGSNGLLICESLIF